ncbi:uncharacterized protein [Typha angustifolia]|uniref:uncharacterized protein isoform X4 n=1 Tax=Typha angustifolia TaxID=59011 RepID=UPI003C2FB379
MPKADLFLSPLFYPAMGSWNLRLLLLFCSWDLLVGFAAGQDHFGSVISSYRERDIWLKPFDWTYLRVELPAWFSSVTMSFVSNVDIDKERMKGLPISSLPMICLKDGSPPIPDLSENYLDGLLSNFLMNGSFWVVQNHSDVEQCIPFQRNMTITLTNEQISPGVWYIGFFNGLGPVRTQSKMRVPKRGSTVPYESYYVPIDGNESIGYTNFFLEHLLSNSSVEQAAWTFFILNIPQGAAGSNIHLQLSSDTKVNYELYLKFGGLPSIDSWDYFASSTSSSNLSNLLALNDSDGKSINIYITYAREGTWCLGLKHPPNRENSIQTSMSISLVGCPRGCSHSGTCHYSLDESGLTFYSYCACNRDHGGFDCSSELVSRKGHMWQSIFLIASNAAALLPAFWALHRKAFAEWILFTSSGISSGLYHACDVGTWCVLSFRVLQFLDFWLSFMAVVGTFIYMATINETSKRAIHTAVFILTALLAATGATRSANIGIVIAIGSLGLLIGWLLEFSAARRLMYCLQGLDFSMSERWQNLRGLLWNLVKTLTKRFRWPFLLLGFIALALAATSWKLEKNNSYWIWHSLWHITIYTSSFFFLCSTRVGRSNDSQGPDYELAHQDSSSRIEPREI